MKQTLHVGVKARHLHALIAHAGQLGLPAPAIDGDGWECWGEPLGEDLNDKKTLHVMFVIEKTSAGVVLELDARASLVRMEANYQAGIYASLTSSEEWSEEHISFRDERPAPAKAEPWFDPSMSAKTDWTLRP